MRKVKVSYRLDKEGKFIIENYNQAPPFSNFLPGISGLWGIPLWVFYVNRGQGVVSFGIKDKNHALLEFLPANKAYQSAPLLGYRTFVKINNRTYYEPFQLTPQYSRKERMVITSFDFTIEEENKLLGLGFKVRYFTLPNLEFAGLVRVVKIKNISSKRLDIKIIDGLPQIVPFGCRDLFLKNLGRTVEAWKRCEIRKKAAIFKLVVDPQDTADTCYIQGTNFAYALVEREESKIIHPSLIIDPQKVFGVDTSLRLPWEFLKREFTSPFPRKVVGKTPCAFFFWEEKLVPKGEVTLYSIFGSVADGENLDSHLKKVNVPFIKEKEEENKRIIEGIKSDTLCVSSSEELNHYIKCTYLDNVLRGGYPYKFNNDKVYYLFSRKHGDLERDYNKFKLLPSYFSEGEVNFRDVNQNRRIDLFFNPCLQEKNIVYFLNLLRIDGYNPLRIEGEKFFFRSEEKIKNMLEKLGVKEDSLLSSFMKRGFYLGEIFTFLEKRGVEIRDKKGFLNLILTEAEREPVACFGEGWWIDHWRYCLDLIESYLYFYPDKLKELFWDKKFMFWDDEYKVRKREDRYVLKGDKVYQLNSVEMVEEKKELIMRRERFKNFLRTEEDKIYKTTLVVKLLSLVLNKVATIDPSGIGIEMEADKPGWCDSLNGLPSLFGSSLCETLELKRACLFIIKAMESVKKEKEVKLELPAELYEFFVGLEELLKLYFSWREEDRDYLWWGKAGSLKERFREKTFFSLNGEEVEIERDRLINFLKNLIERLNVGIKKAKDENTGLYPTYFWYEVKEYQIQEGKIHPLRFFRNNLPLFLEVFVHLLRVEEDKDIYPRVRKSPLFDNKLKMYKLNECLQTQPWEIGRSRAFPRGWLENESVWLHMEYKYLLELIKNGLYEKFYQDFFNCVICFLPPEDYGRSILENSSFIVSSVYPDKSLWGKGFIARLSGSTVEMLNIWMIMCLGRTPFFVDEENNLYIKFSPVLKGKLFTKRRKMITINDTKLEIPPNCFAFKLFSSVLVIYHNPKREDTFKGRIKIKKIIITKDKEQHTIESSVIPPPWSYKIREMEVKRVDVYFE